MAQSVDDAEFNHTVGQEAQAPLATAVWGVGAGQMDEPGLLLPVELSIVLAIWALAMDTAFEASL